MCSELDSGHSRAVSSQSIRQETTYLPGLIVFGITTLSDTMPSVQSARCRAYEIERVSLLAQNWQCGHAELVAWKCKGRCIHVVG